MLFLSAAVMNCGKKVKESKEEEESKQQEEIKNKKPSLTAVQLVDLINANTGGDFISNGISIPN